MFYIFHFFIPVLKTQRCGIEPLAPELMAMLYPLGR